jgi:hypothetical protein
MKCLSENAYRSSGILEERHFGHLAQGGQIGRVFAYGDVVYFWQGFLNQKSIANFGLLFYAVKVVH